MDDLDFFGEENKYVKELTPDSFDSKHPWKLKPDEDGNEINGMVLFYAPWCPHCQKMKQEWVEAAKRTGFCDFLALNCEKYKEHVQKIKEDMPHLIRGYPTIIIYKNSKPNDYYGGERSTKSFMTVCMNMCTNCKID